MRTDRSGGIDPTRLHVESHFTPIYEQEQDFHAAMAEQLRRTPWLALSILLNGLVILFLYLFLAAEPEPETEVIVQIAPVSEPPPDIEKIEPPEVDPEVEIPEDWEVPTETPTEEVSEQPNESFQERDSRAQPSAFDADAWNPAIGTDGGAGGPYGGRNGSGTGPGGPAGRVQIPVGRGLRWLADHQDQDGKWDADGFMKHDAAGKGAICDGPGNPVHDVGVTGLALLAFLADGNTLRAGPHQEVVRRAVDWLRHQQDPRTGLLGTNAAHDFIYDHAIATYALVEAQGLSRSRLLAPVAQRALNYLEAHRNPYRVWRYQPQDNDNDTSVTGWCVMAYESARYFGLQVNPNALDLAATWLEEVTDPVTGRHGYQARGELSSRQGAAHAARFPREHGEAMTAVGLFCRYFLGQDPREHPIMERSADLLLSKPPVHDPANGTVDHYAWYYATYALYQAGGRAWKEWQRHLKAAVVDPQRGDGNAKGSWDPCGVWGRDGGRVYATALNVLTLQVYYRYARIVR